LRLYAVAAYAIDAAAIITRHACFFAMYAYAAAMLYATMPLLSPLMLPADVAMRLLLRRYMPVVALA